MVVEVQVMTNPKAKIKIKKFKIYLQKKYFKKRILVQERD